MKFKSLGLGLMALSFVSFMAIPTFAKGGACKADKEKFCKDVSGHRQVFQCLKQNQDLVSAECRQNMDERKSRHHAARQACQADREKFCGNVEKGKGKIRACMQENYEKLSPACQQVAQKGKLRQAVRSACQADREKFCGQVETGPGKKGKKAIRACMREHKDQLSQQCQGAINEMKAYRKSQKAPSAKRSQPDGSPWQNIKSTMI